MMKQIVIYKTDKTKKKKKSVLLFPIYKVIRITVISENYRILLRDLIVTYFY